MREETPTPESVTPPCVHCKAPEGEHGDRGACLRAGFYGNRYVPERVTLSDEECVALIREISTDFPCLNDNPCEDATNPADRSESLAHHFDCPTLDAWAAVKRILAAREQSVREEMERRLRSALQTYWPESGGQTGHAMAVEAQDRIVREVLR